MKPVSFWIWIIISTCLAGCASAPSKPGPVPGVPPEMTRKESEISITVPITLAESRISFLENRLKQKGLSESEQALIQKLLHAYEITKRYGESPVTAEKCRQLAETLYNTLYLTDCSYFGAISEKSKDEPLGGVGTGGLALERKRMLENYQKGQYKSVIHRCLALKIRMGDDYLTPDMNMLFALSLAGDGLVEEAIGVGLEAVDGLSQIPDRLYLLAEIGGWQVSMGQKQQALQTFARIERIHSENNKLILSLKQKIQEIKPEETAIPSVFQPIESETTSRAGLPPGSFQEKVDGLVQNHEFEEAARLLRKKRAESEEDPETKWLDQALKNVAALKAAYEENQRIKSAYLTETYEAAKQFYEKENFEGAIQKIAALEADQTLNAETRALKNRAIEGLINRERNRAAALFLKAKKTDDPTEKKALFEQCYRILESLIETYPDSAIKPKLMSHLEIVRKELEKY